MKPELISAMRGATDISHGSAFPTQNRGWGAPKRTVHTWCYTLHRTSKICKFI